MYFLPNDIFNEFIFLRGELADHDLDTLLEME